VRPPVESDADWSPATTAYAPAPPLVRSAPVNVSGDPPTLVTVTVAVTSVLAATSPKVTASASVAIVPDPSTSTTVTVTVS